MVRFLPSETQHLAWLSYLRSKWWKDFRPPLSIYFSSLPVMSSLARVRVIFIFAREMMKNSMLISQECRQQCMCVCCSLQGSSCEWVEREERAVRLSIRQRYVQTTVPNVYPASRLENTGRGNPFSTQWQKGQRFCPSAFTTLPRTFEQCLARNERKWQARRKQCTLSFSTATPSAFRLLTS